MREKTAWSLAAALGLLLALSLAGIVRGGPLDPPTGPASTPNGIDGRIPISSLPFTVDAPGSYVVTRNLQRDGGDGITVNADNVTIDLNGFTLDGVGETANGILALGRSNLTVRNGVVRRWANGIYNGPSGAVGVGGLFRDLQIEDNVSGIALAHGGRLDSSIIRSNTYGARADGNGATVSNSTFLDNGTAIFALTPGQLIESNHLEIPTGGIGIQAADFMTVRRNYFSNPSPTLTGYTTIALGAATYVVVIENRIKASLTTGGGGSGNYIPYDVNNALTNISP